MEDGDEVEARLRATGTTTGMDTLTKKNNQAR